MSAYVILTRESTNNEAELEIYRAKAPFALAGRDVQRHVKYGAITPLEGTMPEAVVVISFPTNAEALDWYHSSEYQDALKHRQAGANYRGFIVEGVE